MRGHRSALSNMAPDTFLLYMRAAFTFINERLGAHVEDAGFAQMNAVIGRMRAE